MVTKLDRATDEFIRTINLINADPQKYKQKIKTFIKKFWLEIKGVK